MTSYQEEERQRLHEIHTVRVYFGTHNGGHGVTDIYEMRDLTTEDIHELYLGIEKEKK